MESELCHSPLPTRTIIAAVLATSQTTPDLRATSLRTPPRVLLARQDSGPERTLGPTGLSLRYLGEDSSSYVSLRNLDRDWTLAYPPYRGRYTGTL